MPPEHQKLRVLIVDDDPGVRTALNRVLKRLCTDWELSFAESAENARILLNKQGFEVVVADIMLAGSWGTDLLRLVMERHPATLRVALSGMLDGDTIVQSRKYAHIHLCKPCSADILRRNVLTYFGQAPEDAASTPPSPPAPSRPSP